MSTAPGSPSSDRPRYRTLTRILLTVVVLIAGLPFLPAVGGGYLDYDDVGFLLEVDGWRGLAPENIGWMFSTMHLGHYQPLTYFSYAIEHAIFGMNPRVHHATNILLHMANAALLFALARRVLALATQLAPTAQLVAAAGCAAFWAAHPLRVESVAWITERRDVLSTCFLLLATLAYLRSVRPGETAVASPRWYWASVLFLLLSLLAKAWGITFIAMVLVIDLYPLRRLRLSPAGLLGPPGMRVLLQKLPFAALCIAFAAVAFRSTRAAGNTVDAWGIPERVAQVCFGLVFYIWKTIAPTNLSALYELPRQVDWTQTRWWISAAIVVVTVAAALAIRRRYPGFVAALLVYTILLAPVLGIAQAGIQLVADRYAYIATMPLFITVAAAAAHALATRPQRTRRVATVASSAILLVFAALAWHQSTLWTSDIRLWSSALKNGHDGPLLRNYYGRVLEKARRPDEALQQYRASLEADPLFADTWFGIGNASRAVGDYAAAEAAFGRAAELDSDPTKAYVALGLLYVMSMDRLPDAITVFRKAVDACEARGNPQRTGRPYLMLAAAYGESGNDTEAITWLHEAARWPDTRAEATAHLRDLGVQPLAR